MRLAEPPRLYVPRWSEEIIAETLRNLESRIGLSKAKTAYLAAQLRIHFGDAWVTGHRPLIDKMGNHPKDRHVLAAAVKCGARMIVTYNRRDFPAASTEPFGIEVQGPSAFLKHLFERNTSVVLDKLQAQALNLGRALPEQLVVLRNAVPAFVDIICQEMGIDLEALPQQPVTRPNIPTKH